MSRYFEVLQKAERDKEVIPISVEPEPAVKASSHAAALEEVIRKSAELKPALSPIKVNGQEPSLKGRALEEVTKLVQRIFLSHKEGMAPAAVVFCGVEQGEGSSWMCSRAGLVLARQGVGSVCLVDANLRSPSLHKHFWTENQHGLADVLFRSGSISDSVRSVAGGRVSLLPSGFVTSEMHSQLSGEALRTRLAELRAQFKYLLIDAPPASQHGDAAMLGKLADGVVLIVEANSTRRETTRQVKESLEASGVRVLGAVLNQRTYPIPETIYRKL